MASKEQQRTVLEVWQMLGVSAYKPPKSTNVSTTNDDLICGVELEIEHLVRSRERYMDMAGDSWSVVEDGSLRPRGLAWEFVSRPMRLDTLIPEIEKLFAVIGVKEETNYTDRCSIHVHANVQDFTQEQLASLAMVYPVFEDVLFQYVNHYKKKEEQGYCRDTNLYCIPWSACRMNRKFVENLFNNSAHTHHTWQKYTALNLLPISEKGTVEWRHMHGTCDMEKLTTWMNIIGSIMRYAKEKPFDEIINIIKVMNDVSTYKQFFEEVLRGTLAYDEQYRRLLREGIVNAKYSLLNWEANKDKPKNKKKFDALSSYRSEGDAGVFHPVIDEEFIFNPAGAPLNWAEPPPINFEAALQETRAAVATANAQFREAREEVRRQREAQMQGLRPLAPGGNIPRVRVR